MIIVYPNVVFANAKIQILKQITTAMSKCCIITCCFCKCKDTNFKANHNSKYEISDMVCVVFANAKIQILKQITTQDRAMEWIRLLFLQMQRYKF